ncbi:MAG: sugar ABC transporter ATP-binding protein [Armatimonadota bacterium]
MNKQVLKLTGITKRFGEASVLNNVDFDLLAGEVHALVGENGAGKSTLMKIASGIHMPDTGRISVNGQEMAFKNPHDAGRAGIAMVHQELSLAPDLSVAENIFVGRSPVNGKFMGWQELNNRASGMLSDFCLAIDPTETVSSLGIGSRQVVEILKALAADPKIIIFDEPTSSLEAQETELVLDTIRKLANKGIGVVYISHRMDEVFGAANRITVLRDGELVATKFIENTNREEVINLMVGRELREMYPDRAEKTGMEMLKVENLTKNGVFRDISFSLKKGEILGFSGLVGSGRTEVMRVIFGADQADSGIIHIDGEKISPKSVKEAMDAGVAYLSEDRKSLGLFLDRSIEDNIVCANLDRCASGRMMSSTMSRSLAEEYSEKLKIKSQGIDQEVRSLSGGNQQKTLLARWMSTQPVILIVDEPTRGVDIGAKSEIHKMLRDYANSGNSVIVVSSEMPEIIGLCDRIIVMHEGRISGEIPGATATEEQLIQLAVK